MAVIHSGTVIEGAAERIRRVKVALGVADTGGGVLAWQNPEDIAIIVRRVTFDVTTKSTGACTLDVGAAANATTSSDTLMDGIDVGTAAGVFDNIENQGTNGASNAKLAAAGGATDYVTASKATGAAAGLVGFAYIDYMVI